MISCEQPTYFVIGIATSTMCDRLVFQFCMSQRQYYQITNATHAFTEYVPYFEKQIFGNDRLLG